MCNSCEALTINGVYCHEHGCPDAWKDETRKCEWCGQDYKPGAPHAIFCSTECWQAYNG